MGIEVTSKMNTNKQLTKKISGAVLIILGTVFGGTWKSKAFCLGDHVFSALGIPVWSNGTKGTHYPGIVSLFVILIGIGILNTTLSKKERLWIWGGTILIILIISFCSAYV